jgi:hypothetical protein
MGMLEVTQCPQALQNMGIKTKRPVWSPDGALGIDGEAD